MSSKSVKIRCAIIALLMFVSFGGLGFRLAFLHLGDHEKASRKIESKIIAGRGNIYDCKGNSNILALNLPLSDVCVDPGLIISSNTVSTIASELATVLDVKADEVAVNIRHHPESKYLRIQRFVHEEKVNQIKTLGLAGVFFDEGIVRYYPHGQFMCHVLGFVNYEGVGSMGIEQKVDKYLSGCPGLLESKVDAKRHELYMRRGRHIPAMEGAHVTLTIDQNIQYVVEKALDDIVEEHKPAGAWAIVQRVSTGEILAMASRPAFDLNEFREADADVRLNRAIGSNYEPGSTMKALTIAAALNEKVVTPDTVVNCEQGNWFYAGKVLTDGGHSYGPLTVTQIIKKSSNIGTAKVSLMLGKERQSEYMKNFGLGKPLDIDLPGEESGILPPVEKWSKTCPTRMAFGQAYSVTALQVLSVFSTIANDGYRMKPYIIKEVVREDGSVIYRGGPEIVNRPISSETAEKMRHILAEVTEDGGTGRRARVEGYTVAGKTGTAQKVKNGTYSEWVGSFVGFLPAENPEIAVIVVVDEPSGLHAGGVIAAPAFSDIAQQAVRYLDIEPAEWSAVARR